MEKIIKELENEKIGEKFHDFVIDDAIFYIKKAIECIEHGKNDPKKWYTENMDMAKTFIQLFPAIYQLQQTHTTPQTREN